MRTAILILLTIALVASCIAFNAGHKITRITPTRFLENVADDLPDRFNLIEKFTTYYGDDDGEDTFGEKLKWFANSAIAVATFPVDCTRWLFKAVYAVVVNFHYLYETEVIA